MIVGDEPGITEFAQEFGLEHVPKVKRNEHGTPLLPSIFEIMGRAPTRHVGLINSDIVFPTDALIRAWQAVQARFEHYLMIGQRTTCAMGPLDFSEKTWRQAALAMAEGRPLDTAGAIDYFLWSKGTYDFVPPLALGRTAWDNWLVGNISRGAVINATPCVVALHPRHGYGPSGTQDKGYIFASPEARENRRLCSGAKLHSVNHATWTVEANFQVNSKHGRGRGRSAPVLVAPAPAPAASAPGRQAPAPASGAVTDSGLYKTRRGYTRRKPDPSGRPMMATAYQRKEKPKVHDPGVGGMRSI
jgi:hypothetical protein